LQISALPYGSQKKASLAQSVRGRTAGKRLALDGLQHGSITIAAKGNLALKLDALN